MGMHYLLTLEAVGQSSRKKLSEKQNITQRQRKQNFALVSRTRVPQGQKDILTHC